MDTSCFISTRPSLPGVVFVDSESALSSLTDIYGFDSDSSKGCEGIFIESINSDCIEGDLCNRSCILFRSDYCFGTDMKISPTVSLNPTASHKPTR